MSAFIQVETQLKDQDCLVKALEDLGFIVEVHETPQPLRTWQRSQSGTMANVIVRSGEGTKLGRWVNDLGFLKEGTGKEAKFQGIYSGENQARLESQIFTQYNIHGIQKMAKKHRWKVEIPKDHVPGQEVTVQITSWK